MKTLLERHFDTAFDAPDGIKRLRELILSLAMQGKLVKQDPNDPPATDLLKEIEAEKKRLAKTGKIKQPKSLPPIKPEEVPYELPKGWEWVRLNEALDVRDGTHDTPKYMDKGYPLITSKNIYTGTLSFDDVKFISEEDHKKIADRSKVDRGDILFAMIGSIGNPVIVDCNTEFSIKNVALFKRYKEGKPNNKFLHYFLLHAQDNMKRISSGAVQSFVSLGFLRDYLFPLPPLPEQHRIVAKIDQLMARCDTLEKLRTERDQKRITVHAAAIRQLLDPASLPSRPQHVQHFLFSHFPELYAVKENVTELRKAILQLAVMGKLVKFDVKEHTKTVGDHFEFLNGYAFKSEWFKQSGIRLCRNINVSHAVLEWRDVAYVDESVAKEYSRFSLCEGDIVLSLDRPIIATGLKVARIRKADLPCLLLQRVAKPVPRHKGIDMDYFFMWLNSPAFIDTLNPGRSNGVPHISTREVERIPFPLPPLAEQHRIVAKIDQLMALCDAMENQITSATHKQTTLLTALMAKV